jgi:hypothetical protein
VATDDLIDDATDDATDGATDGATIGAIAFLTTAHLATSDDDDDDEELSVMMGSMIRGAPAAFDDANDSIPMVSCCKSPCDCIINCSFPATRLTSSTLPQLSISCINLST